MIKLNMTQ